MAGGVGAGARPRGSRAPGGGTGTTGDGARVPSVVAVLATRDPGPWFDETLAGLAAQDYPELSVLVLVTGEDDPTERVAEWLPSAFVRRLPEDRGYGAAVDEALDMVQGAAFFLLCHDDCAPDPHALHVMVEESYRSNAGVVTPKMVRWEDPSVLLHVGLHADRTGAVVERVAPGEIDHGQHDGVMDVFVAPGGFTLVRADLFRELGGYDNEMAAMGEDLDLCWRAHVAGARVIVAPDARVRHLEALASGVRSPPAAGSGLEGPPTLQQLQRRHELRAALASTGRLQLVLVGLLSLALGMGEVVVSLAVGDRRRARAVVDAWRWNLSRGRDLRRRRAEVARRRVLSDREVRALQLRGSARLSTYATRLAYQGFEVAHGVRPATAERVDLADGEGTPFLTGSVGAGFSENADFDELDDLGRRGGTDRFGRRVRRQLFGTRRARLVAWLVAVLVLVIGSRGLLGERLPLTGQFLPFISWTGTWHQLVAGWQPAGVGTTAPASPGFAILGALGTLLLGHMGELQKVLVLVALPIGAWGVARFLRPFASPRGRFAGALCSLGLALPYDALARGRWDGLVAYAVAPWVLGRLARATGREPFAPDGVGWRTTLAGQVLVLGAVETVAVALAPATALVVLLCGAGLALGALVLGDRHAAGRAAAVAAGSTLLTAVLCLPWLVGTLSAGTGALSVLGMTAPWSGAPGWSDLLRFAVGPVGGTALSWLLLAAAVLPLLIARQSRLAWAARLWAVAGSAWLLALVVARGWSAPFTPSVDVLLAPAATAVACSIGLGVAAFEHDLTGYTFGWRQVAAVAAVAAVGIGLLPVVVEAGDGRWGLPSTGYAQPLASLVAPRTAAAGDYRVLWLGAPQVLPTGSWPVDAHLAYATTEASLPNVTDLWMPAGAGPASALARDVTLAAEGRTVRLGRLLAVAAVRYVVVVEDLVPEVTGQRSLVVPPPVGLVSALSAQEDLLPASTSGGGYQVYENTDFVPARAVRAGGPVPVADAQPSATDVAGWHRALTHSAGREAYSGRIRGGTVISSSAPAGSWHLTVDGLPATRQAAYGWASQFTEVRAGAATLQLRTSLLDPLAVLAELAVWLGVVGVLLGRRRSLDWWWQPLRRRFARPGAEPTGELEAAPGPPDTAAQEDEAPAVAGAAGPRHASNGRENGSTDGVPAAGAGPVGTGRPETGS